MGTGPELNLSKFPPVDKNVKNNLDTYNITPILLLVIAVVQNRNHVDLTLVCCFLFLTPVMRFTKN